MTTMMTLVTLMTAGMVEVVALAAGDERVTCRLCQGHAARPPKHPTLSLTTIMSVQMFGFLGER